jgi:hypothetical protein
MPVVCSSSHLRSLPDSCSDDGGGAGATQLESGRGGDDELPEERRLCNGMRLNIVIFELSTVLSDQILGIYKNCAKIDFLKLFPNPCVTSAPYVLLPRLTRR